MRLVITGAAGFIGSVLSARAIEDGHEVLALDNLSRGLNKVWACGAMFDGHDCMGGLLEAPSIRRGWRTGESDGPIVHAVVHLAAGTGSLDRPIEELRALNVEMTKRVFFDARHLRAPVFVFPTTSLALGVPDSPYVKSKEEALAWLQEQAGSGYPTVLPLRFFNVIGAYKGFTERRKNEVHIIPTLVDAWRERREFVINGNDWETHDGTPGRDFVNVIDVADYILHLIKRKLMGESLDHLKQDDGAIWVGTGEVTTARQVLHTFEQWVLGPGERLKFSFGPRRAFDIGFLRCTETAAHWVRHFRLPAPAWVGIRDEARELLRGRKVYQAE